jgi:hypothetical protein
VLEKNKGLGPERELHVLKARLDRLERETAKFEKLEKSLAYHEIVLAKKVTDMHHFEEKLEKHVNREVFEDLKKEMKRINKHEELIFENAKYIREIINELGKLKESHRLVKEQASSRSGVSRDELEERMSQVRSSLASQPQSQRTLARKGKGTDVAEMQEELSERLEQIEYQNKLIMKYLRAVDETLVKSGYVKN